MTRAAVVTPWVGAGTESNPNRPAVADAHTVSSWADATGQPAELIPLGLLPYTIEAEADDAVLDQIEADPAFALLWRGSPPDTLDAATLRAQLANVLHADVAEWCATDASTFEDVQARLSEAQHRPPWQAGEAVAVDEVRAYEASLYRCVQAHTTQSDWTPTAAPALWTRFHEPDSDPWPWVQPQGAHDAIPIGQRRTHEGGLWIVREGDASGLNSWAPGVFGWERLSDWPLDGEPSEPDEPAEPDAWAVGVAYTVGERVTYGGSTYECRQAHTSQAGWTPTAVPALWALVP